MTETVVENEICPTCGTELPAAAEFCYHCGNSIKVKIASENETQEVSDVWMRGDIADDSNTNNHQAIETLDTNVETAVQENDLEKDLEEFQKKSEDSELKSAASMRVKAKKPRTKKVEIKWEEPGDATNVWFIAGAGLLAVLTMIIFALAMYLR